MKNITIITLLALIVSSCDLKEDYNVVNSATYQMNGQYFVKLDMKDSAGVWVEDPYSLGYVTIKITNTAANDPDSIWIDDLLNWPLKAKIKCNPTTGTFEPGTFNANFAKEILAIAEGDTTTLPEFKDAHPIKYKEVSVDRHADAIDSVMVSGYGNTVKVISGSIENGTYKAPSKTMTDAINIELEFGDDPGTTYRYKGYRRTGFLEDEH